MPGVPTGILLVLLSAAGFGAMGVFGKLAYEEGSTVATLLSVRFVVAALLLWAVVLATGRWRALPRRDLAIALALGAVGYGAQAGAYFAALDRLDASVLAMLVYTFPVIVTVAAVLLGRDAASSRTAVALGLGCGGLALVLTGSVAGALDGAGVVLGLAAAGCYSVYILISEGVGARIGPLVLAALLCTGAATTLTAGGLVSGQLDLGAVSPEGLGWLVALAVVSTVGAIALFLAGLQRVGPSSAAILSTLEPVVTVVGASVVFGETLGPAQLAGGALVLSAVLVLRVPAARTAVAT